jgi:AcrR family transcriptional regulator
MAPRSSQVEQSTRDDLAEPADADWQRRVVGRSLRTAAERSVDRGMNLIRAAAAVLERTEGDDITVQEVADEAGQSLRTLYQYFESKDDLLLAVFEEAMRTYAVLIEQSIGQLDDPLERLAGAMVAAARMPEFSGPGFDRGLVRLRLRLSQTRPDLVARAQEALTSLVRGLVEAAAASGRLDAGDPEAATFMILSLNAAVITAETVGNDAGVHRPDVVGLTSFCLQGLGARLEDNWDTWYESVVARLRFPKPRPGRTRSLTKVAKSRSTGRQRAKKAR